VQSPVGAEHTVLAVFAPGSSGDLRLENALGMVEVLQADLGQSSVQVPENGWKTATPPETDVNYRAVVVSLPRPPLGVLLSGDAEGIRLIRQALTPNNLEPEVFVQALDADGAGAPLLLEVVDGQYRVSARGGRVAVIEPRAGAFDAVKAKNALEQIARWLEVRSLRNPTPQWLTSTSVSVTVQVVTGPPEPDPAAMVTDLSKLVLSPEVLDLNNEIRLEYGVGNVKPRLLFTITNQTSTDLFVSLVDTTERYGIAPLTFGVQDRVVQLPPNSSVMKRLFFSVPDALYDQGVTEVSDLFKLIISTDQFDPLAQLPLNVSVRSNGATKSAVQSTLARVFRKIGFRDADEHPGNGLVADWITQDFNFITVRPQKMVRVANDGQTAQLAGVQLQSHPTLQAEAKLVTLQTATRGLGGAALPPILQDQSGHVQPFQFGVAPTAAPTGLQARSAELEVSALELTAPEGLALNPQKVTADQPLILQLAGTLADNEVVLATGFDPVSRLWLPLGVAREGSSGLELKLEYLPEPTGTGDRSIGSAIRILFHRFIASTFKLDDPYPLLRLVDRSVLLETGKVAYSATGDSETVKQAVTAAQTVLLVVHGIIGDTESMVPALAPKHLGLEDVPALAERYDVILTLDYECLRTGIIHNAEELKKRLEEVGLKPGHTKTVNVLVHSMGGLVTRYFIERLDGHAVIDKLVMFGTPNNGSPLPGAVTWVQRTITTLAVVGLNALGTVAWPVRILSSAIGWLGRQKLENLEEMKQDSDVLKSLFSANDPGVDYVVLCGDITLNPERKAVFDRLRDQLATTAFFFDQPNDIATGLTSSRQIPSGRNPAPLLEPALACDHLSYFASREAILAMTKFLQIP
jgi:pimeloyl-ACP methyl ester carboxylesterase